MHELMARAFHRLCLWLGRLLRAGRYSTTRIVHTRGAPAVRKRRAFYAPLLLRLGEPLMRVLRTGVRVLPQPEWEERERLLYHRLYDASVRVQPNGELVLPWLPGETLAALLEHREVGESVRRAAMRCAAVALAELHRRGFTHGDAMAENVMIDVETGAARWFDFETAHDPARPAEWRRADDVRALLATCLLRTDGGNLDATVGLVVDSYGDDRITGLLAAEFLLARAPLAFHLGQAPLSYRRYREAGRSLARRVRRP